MSGKFEISKDKAGKHRFHLKAANGEIIASSEGYKTKAGGENGIQSIKTNAPRAAVVDLTE
ncbi:YegP family protein [Mycobacterium sp.]|uniref:YegP family protein n=1 Tax=Mycobacterium sp. TaxID=1785 RepID=UPI003F9BA4D6